MRTLKEGDCLNAGKLQLQIIAPAVSASGADVNEDGMVIKVKYEEFLGLLTGDIGEETEKKIAGIGNVGRCGLFEGGTPWLPLLYLSTVS